MKKKSHSPGFRLKFKLGTFPKVSDVTYTLKDTKPFIPCMKTIHTNVNRHKSKFCQQTAHSVHH
jgi:hypothetical protein